MTASLRRLANRSIRARRRPWAIALLWGWETLLGLALGSAFASVASGAYARHPDGDAPLFAPGGLELLDLLRHSRAAMGPLFCATLGAAILAHIAGLLPSATVFAELAFVTPGRNPPPFRAALARGISALPASFTIGVLTLVTQATFAVVGVLIAAVASPGAVIRLGEPGADKLALAVAGMVAVLALSVGVVGDLARAIVVAERAPALTAIGRGVDSFLTHPVALLRSYAWRTAAAWVPVVIGAALATRVGGRGGAALVVLGAFHQLVVVVRVSIRTSWMARCLRGIT
jgi:hypothetical protein